MLIKFSVRFWDHNYSMSYKTNTDNIFAEGTVITAKENPGLKLVITKYFQRIYYCAVVNEPDAKHFAYFDRELIPPAVLNESE